MAMDDGTSTPADTSSIDAYIQQLFQQQQSQGISPEQPVNSVMPNYNTSMPQGMSPQQVTSGSGTEVGTPSLTDILQGKYQSDLGRAADPSGLAYWTQQIQSGQITPDQIDAIFAASPEGVLHGQTGKVYDPNAVNAVNSSYPHGAMYLVYLWRIHLISARMATYGHRRAP